MLQTFRQNLLRTDNNFQLLLLASLIILLGAMGIFTTEIYIPSLPAIAQSLNTTHAQVQLSVSLYLFAMAISQLVYGPLSDHHGRRKILFLGLGIYLIGSFIAIFAPSIQILILGRFIQGIGIGAPMCLTRSILRDIFSGHKLAQIGAHFSLVFSIAPAIAPVLGSYLQHWFDWRANFVFLAAMGGVGLGLIWLFLPETCRHRNAESSQYKVILKNYLVLFRNKTFMGYTLCSSAAIAGILVYYAMSPFILQNEVGLTVVQYGWLAIITTAAMILSRVINSRLLKKFTIQPIVTLGNALMLLGGICMLFLGMKMLNVFVIIIPTVIFILGTGLLFSNALAGALTPFPEIAGTAGALLGSIQIFVAFLVTFVVVNLTHKGQVTLALILAILGLLSSIIFYFTVTRTAENLVTEKRLV